MHTKTIDVQDAQANLPELLLLVRKGTEVVLTDGATPLARLVPVICSTQPRVAGLHTGAVWASDDFDEPLAEDFFAGT